MSTISSRQATDLDHEAQNRNPALPRSADEALIAGPDEAAEPASLDPEGKVNTGQFRSDPAIEHHPSGRSFDSRNERQVQPDDVGER
ncbi:MAG: hypothetical protein QOG62_2079 [Thermoleophilaceae bacterium]|jgi:hypothetical protein|nr:hypothetical protein [Thermoleophilaceae bacterium]MEA2623076.1 hypothetical protein [Chloroflexota bacterium]